MSAEPASTNRALLTPPAVFSTNATNATNATSYPAATTATPNLWIQLLNKIPLPRWAVYAIFALGGLLIFTCVICICVKCCCRGKKRKKKEDQINLKGVSGSTTTALVQPGAGDADYGAAKRARGKLLYSLEFCSAQSELTVGIKQAAALKAMDLGGTSDPYVKVYVVPEKTKTCETKVFRSTLNPVFNEQFTYPITKPLLQESTVVMQVFDFNRFTKHDIIGELRVPLASVDWNHVMEEWQELGEPAQFEEENLGEICFSLRYVPTTSKLTVIILEAKNLKSMDLGGSSDPFVKVQIALDKKKWKKKKTSVKKKTLNPYFNESFTFEVSFEQIQRIHLVISVWDRDTLTRDDAIGKIYLGCDAAGNQLRHWADMLSSPRRPVAQWHHLLSAQQVNSTLALKHSVKIPFTNRTF